MKSLIRMLFFKYCLPTHKFELTDVIKSTMSDDRYMVEGLVYNTELQPLVFVSDKESRKYCMLERDLGVIKNTYQQPSSNMIVE